MGGTSNNYVVFSIARSFPFFNNRTSNPLAGAHPSMGQKRRPPRRGRCPRFKAGSPELQGRPRTKPKCEGCSGDEPT